MSETVTDKPPVTQQPTNGNHVDIDISPDNVIIITPDNLIVNNGASCSKEPASFFIESDAESPCNSPNRKPYRCRYCRHGNLQEVRCSPQCPGHRKHSNNARDSGDSPRPHRHHDKKDTDGQTQGQERREGRCKHRQNRKLAKSGSDSPKKDKPMKLHDLVDEATDGGLGTRQYHSAGHISEMHAGNAPKSPGMKQRDFSMSHINPVALTEEELRLPRRKNSNSSSRSESPLRTIHHHVKIERWEKVTDGELNVANMHKKFDWQGFSHIVHEIRAGEEITSAVAPEVRKIGLVSGKLCIKMYQRKITLVLGDIIEIPANQAYKASADESGDTVLIMGQRESCCIS